MIRTSVKNDTLIFRVRVVPRASRSEIVGEYNGALRVRLAAPPVDGAANEELIQTIAQAFGLPRNAVQIASGHASRDKQVAVSGVSESEFVKLIKSREARSHSG
jgi:hypothetical protein